MTTPDLHVDTGNQRGFASRTRTRTADFHYEPADADGTWPSQQSTRRFHGTVKAAGQGFSDDLGDVADHSDRSADEHDKRESSAGGSMKDLMSMGTGLLKDAEAAAADLGKTVTTTLTTVGTSATQAATTGLNAAITAASTGAKGGAPVPLPPNTGAPPDSPTTNHHNDTDKGRHHADADANT